MFASEFMDWHFNDVMVMVARELSKTVVHKYRKGEYHEPTRFVHFQMDMPINADIEFRREAGDMVRCRLDDQTRYRDCFIVTTPFHIERLDDGSFVARNV